MPRLQVMVGPDRFHMEECRVNDSRRPHEFETEHWVGRVLVRIVDAPGAKEGEEGREYFKDRSRRFCIQIEGRFKQPLSGDDVLFGTDFDKMIDFPRAPFNAGMRVAKYIDPCTFYEESPPSGRPYIMSPYCACMNTFCAWPAPSRAHDAVVVLRHTHTSTPESTPILNAEKSGDAHSKMVAPPSPVGSDGQPLEGAEDDDVVPVETLPRIKTPDPAAEKANKRRSWFGSSKPKEQRQAKRYWRFVGFIQDPRVRALLEAHHAKLKERPARSASTSSNVSRSNSVNSSAISRPGSPANAADVQHGHGSSHPTISKLGSALRNFTDRHLSPSDHPGTPEPIHSVLSPADSDVSRMASPDIIRGESPVTRIKTPSLHPASASQQMPTQADAKPTVPQLVRPKPKHAEPEPLSAEEEAKAAADAKALAQQPANGEQSKPEMPPLERISTNVREQIEAESKGDGLRDGDFKLADALHGLSMARSASRQSQKGQKANGHEAAGKGEVEWESKLDEQLGPWRFSDPGTDMIEDNAFIFTTKSVDVKARRKYFANDGNRKALKYDPDVVYAASFFTDACDLNTLNISLGPVRINVARFFKDMPIRYTLRHAKDENITFATVSFQIVD